MGAKLQGFPGRKSGVAMVCLGLILVIFGILWLGVFWPKMTLFPCPMDNEARMDADYWVLDPATGQFNEILATTITSVWANVTVDGTVFVHSDQRTYSRDLSTPFPQWNNFQTMAVDRKTAKFDMSMWQYSLNGAVSGYYMPPRGLKEGATFNTMHISTATLQTMVYGGDEVFISPSGEKIDVQVWRMYFKDLPTAIPPGMTVPFLANGNYTYWIEPDSGMILDILIDEYYDVEYPGMPRMTTFKETFWFQDETIENCIDDAHQINTMFPLMGKTLPWTAIGIGAVLMLGGIVLYMRKGKQQPR